MFKLRKARERGYTRLDWLESWHTFSFDQYYDPKHNHFGPLRVINEDTIAAKSGFGTHAHSNMEILTYVLQGTLEHKDSLGNGSLIVPGELQRMTAGTGIRHSEYNHSASDSVHLLQIWIIPAEEGLIPGYEQKSFDIKYGDGWQLLASAGNEKKSLHLNQDLSLYAAKMKVGEKLVYEISSGRAIWLQIVEGDLEVNNQKMQAGDGASLTDAELIEFHASTAAHVLLFDLSQTD